MESQLSQLQKLLIKLEALTFTIGLTNKQFSQYPPETILKGYNELIQKFEIAQDTPKSLEPIFSELLFL
ncbi:hypothetical protein QIA41_04975 (plasmid) [Borreliella sinica]|uniref:hypothetical protein n=1 Tax=Borreliella sinica TaxID=87162 RepID=UPI003AF184DB